jgi:hypothetical protein
LCLGTRDTSKPMPPSPPALQELKLFFGDLKSEGPLNLLKNINDCVQIRDGLNGTLDPSLF